MAKSTPLTCLRSSLTSVLLPEPEGAEMMNRIPATFLFFLFELSALSFQPSAFSYQLLAFSSQLCLLRLQPSIYPDKN
jgi:hypothetical protein